MFKPGPEPSPPERRAASWLLLGFDVTLVVVGAVVLLACLLGVRGDSRFQAAHGSATAPRAPLAKVAERERDSTLQALVWQGAQTPVSGAEVRVLWEQQGRYFDAGSGTTDGEGRITLARVPRGVVWVLAEAPGLSRASTQLVVEGGTRQLKLELTPATLLKLRVSDEQHAPLSGATVLVTGADPLPFGALTDHAGEARFGRLGAGPFHVKASAPGYESVARAGVQRDTELSLRRLGSITVRVKDASGKPALGARVEIGGATLWPARSAETDATGACRIAGLLAGSYDLRASQGSRVSRVLVGLLLSRGEDQEVTLTLEPGRFVTALVTDGTGPNPHLVPGADVVLAEEGLSTFPLRGRSGADGKVTLGPISPGPATLSGRAPDFVGSAMVAVPDELRGPVTLPLQRGGVLTGQVVDARDYPVDGATIEIIGSDSSGLPIAETPALLRFRRSHFSWALAGPPPLVAAGELGVMPGPIPPIPGSNAALAAAALGAAGEPLDDDEEIAPWISGSGGRFRAAPVTPGRVRALVRHPDFVEGVSEAVLLAPGGEAHVKVKLLRGGSLEGRVTDERDNPVAAAEVEVIAERGTFQRGTITASDGSFAFSALPREVTLSVRRPEDPMRVAKRVPVTVEEGERETLEIVLPALREALELEVLDDEGRPLELAEINVLSLDSSAPLRTTGFSDADGELVLTDARGLPLRISVQAPGFVRQVLSLAPDDGRARVELKLSRGSLVQGRVTALRGRRGVEGALVTLTVQGLRKTTTTNADGEYTLSDVALGPAKLQASHPDFADGSLPVTIESSGRRDRAFELPPLDLEEPGSVEGEVVDERGEPVAGARVAVGRAPSYLPAGPLPRGVAVTDAQGAFRLDGLSSGAATLDAFSPDHGRGSTRVEVESNRTRSRVRITLSPAAGESEPFAPGGVAVTLGERSGAEGREVVVVSVAEGSEAERAGLLAGDVITAINEVRPRSMREARERLSGPLQSDVVIGVQRGADTQRLVVMREPVRR